MLIMSDDKVSFLLDSFKNILPFHYEVFCTLRGLSGHQRRPWSLPAKQRQVMWSFLALARQKNKRKLTRWATTLTLTNYARGNHKAESAIWRTLAPISAQVQLQTILRRSPIKFGMQEFNYCQRNNCFPFAMTIRR